MKKLYTLTLAAAVALGFFNANAADFTIPGDYTDLVALFDDQANIEDAEINVTLTANQTVTKRIGPSAGKTINISGNGSVEITSNQNAGNIWFLVNQNNSTLNFNNVIFTETSKTWTNSTFECSKGSALLGLNNVVIRGINCTKDQGIVNIKGANANLNTLTFDGCTLAEGYGAIYVGKNSTVTLAGQLDNASLRIEESSLTVNASGVTGVNQMIPVILQNEFTDGQPVVKNTTHLEWFRLPGVEKCLNINGSNLVQATTSIVNERQQLGYANLAKAIELATSNDELTLVADYTDGSRIGVSGKDASGTNDKYITLRGATGNERIISTVNASTISILMVNNEKAKLTLENLIIDGNNTERTQHFIECNNTTELNLRDVTFQNIKTSNNQGIICIKSSSAHTSFENVKFVNCKSTNEQIGGSYMFFGKSVMTIGDGCEDLSISIEKPNDMYPIIYSGTETPASPIRLHLANNYWAGLYLVENCKDQNAFEITTPKYELVPTFDNKDYLKIARSVYFVGVQNGWNTSSDKMTTTDGVFYTILLQDGLSGKWKLCDSSWDWSYAAGEWGVSAWNTKCDIWHNSNKECDVTSNGTPTYIVFKYNSNESESSKVLVVTRGIHFAGAQTGESGWSTTDPDYKFATTDGLNYTLNIPDGITGNWKICDGTWYWCYGKAHGEDAEINLGSVYNLTSSDDNFHRKTKGNTTLYYNMWDNTLRIESLITIGWDNSEHNWETPRVHYSLDGENFFVKEMTKWHAESAESQSTFRRLRSLEADAWTAEIPENSVAMTFSGDGVNTISQTYNTDKIDHMNIYDGNGNVTGVEEVEAVNPVDLPVEYYNLQGQRVANPANGIFIRRQGNNTVKVRIL